jgi:hypothetical protein
MGELLRVFPPARQEVVFSITPEVAAVGIPASGGLKHLGGPLQGPAPAALISFSIPAGISAAFWGSLGS